MSTWNVLLRAAASGDEAAVRQVIEKYGSLVEKIVRDVRLPIHISRRDVTQEVWTKVWLSINTFDALNSQEDCEGAFCNWLKTTAHRKSLTIINREGAQFRTPPGTQTELNSRCAVDDDTTPSGLAAEKETRSRLAKAIDALPDAEARKILRLRYYKELDLNEISEKTGLSVERVRYKLNTTLNHLQYHI